MILGSFAGSRVGDLHRVTGTLNQKGYHNILQRHAIPSGLCLVRPKTAHSRQFSRQDTSRRGTQVCLPFGPVLEPAELQGQPR